MIFFAIIGWIISNNGAHTRVSLFAPTKSKRSFVRLQRLEPSAKKILSWIGFPMRYLLIKYNNIQLTHLLINLLESHRCLCLWRHHQFESFSILLADSMFWLADRFADLLYSLLIRRFSSIISATRVVCSVLLSLSFWCCPWTRPRIKIPR